MESALTMVPPLSRARASARADLPEAVGPAMRTARPGSIIAKTTLHQRPVSVSHVATLISSPGEAAVIPEALRMAGGALGGGAGEARWLCEGVAADVPFRPQPGPLELTTQQLRQA